MGAVHGIDYKGADSGACSSYIASGGRRQTTFRDRAEQSYIISFAEPRLEKSPFGNGFGPPGAPGAGAPPGLNPMAAQFMALNHPAAAAQAAQAAFLQQSGLPAHFAAAAAAGLPGAAAAAAAAAAVSASNLPSPGVTSSPTMSGGGPFGARPDPAQLMKGPGIASLEALQR